MSHSDTQVLESGEIEVIGRIVAASNASLFCKVTLDDKSVNAIYKPITGERPLWDFPDGKLAWREVATYLVSENLGLNCVPPTILRDGPFGEGSLQLWIDDVGLYGTFNSVNEIPFLPLVNVVNENNGIDFQIQNNLISSIKIFNIEGKEMKRISVFKGDNFFSTMEMPNGEYFFHMLNEKNISLGSGKFVVAK